EDDNLLIVEILGHVLSVSQWLQMAGDYDPVVAI
ncbi:unnamed protein product, partial [marine sediment metagenome]